MQVLETLAVALVADASEYKKGLQKASGDTDHWAKGIVGNVGKLAGGALVAGAGLAIGAVASIGAAAFNVSNDVDTAAKHMAGSLGIPIEEARLLADTARNVYGNNFADSIGDAAAAVQLVTQTLGLAATDPALQTITENAFRLRDAFGVDVGEGVSAAKTLMDNFGLSSTEAFDMLAAGYQRGLDRSGDFLDTVNEYSTQFANGGADAGQFFSLLESGLAGGALGTDKAADAFKEFRLRIQDGTGATAEALDALEGTIDSGILAGLKDGSVSAADAFELVIEGLNKIEDPTVRMQTGAALLGTQFEDLGDSAVGALTLTKDWATGSEGAIDQVDQKYKTWSSFMEGMWRKLTTNISPYTDKLLEMANDALPKVDAAFTSMSDNIVPIMDGIGNTINTVVNYVKGLFTQWKGAVDSDALGPLQYWQNWANTNLPLVQTLFDNVLGAIQGFWTLFGDDIMRIVDNTFNTIWTTIDTVLRTVGDLITLFLQVLTGDWEGAGETLKGIVQRLWDALYTIVSTQLDSLRTLFTSVDWAAVGESIIDNVKRGISDAWGRLKSWFERKLAELTALLPFSEPKDPSSPLRGLGDSGEAVIDMFRGGMARRIGDLSNTLGVGLDSMLADPTTPALAAPAGDTYQITVNLTDGTYESGRSVGRGILDELRSQGRR